MKGTIVWAGDRGTGKSPHNGKTTINGVTDKAALLTLAGVLAGYTTCNRGRASVSDYDAGNPQAPGNGSNIDEKGVVYMKDNNTDAVISLKIPSWDLTGHPVETKDEGDRLADADVQAIAAAVATATGKSLTGTWGKHIKVT